MPGTIRSNHDDPLVREGTFGDFRDQLRKDGYCIVPGVISPEKAQYYVNRTMQWLKDFKLGFDPDNRETWTADNLPLHGPSGIFSSYAVGHEDFVWEARCEPGVIDAYKKLWGTAELLVSFDAINVSLPKRKDGAEGLKFWPHIDQKIDIAGFDCPQGIVNLTKVEPQDGGLVVLSGSSALFEEYWSTEGPNFHDKDRKFTEEHLKWFYERGCEWVKVAANPGDLIIWDSRTIHYGAPAEGDRTRVVFYACYAPRQSITPENLELRKEMFNGWQISGHHPTRIFLHKRTAPLRNGQPDPVMRTEPIKKPDLDNPVLRRLVGLDEY
ncbi:hypothetical protein BT69DRAFT_1276014 [Atractiella rhizophila]|nr:hypothetical protein BT69DRAFT_1276014 [Atractiella rhizophila]